MLVLRLLCTLFMVRVLTCTSVQEAETFLQKYNKYAAMLSKMTSEISWGLTFGNVPKKKVKYAVAMQRKAGKYTKILNDKAEIIYNNTKDLGNLPRDVSRQLWLITEIPTPRNEVDAKQLSKTTHIMTKIYTHTTVKIKVKGKVRKLQLNAHLMKAFKKVTPERLGEMLWSWKAWRAAVGPKIKPHFIKMVQLSNKGAQQRGYKDLGHLWQSDHDMKAEKFIQKTAQLNKEIQRFYKKLHAYVRFKLRKSLGDNVIDENGMMPAHLFGMWPNSWENVYHNVAPLPSKKLPDITKKMKEKGMKKMTLVKMAEKFFTDIGFERAPKTFWTKSVFKKQKKKTPCLAAASDIGKGDVRIKMPCLGVSEQQLKTLYHEMGHIKYYQSYVKQPYVYRKAANQGIQEAVGDAIALSLAVPSHLKTIGLLDEIQDDKGEDLNFLMRQALKMVTMAVYAYSVELWRWSVFRGDTKPNRYNADWWKIRNRIMGIKSPIPRSESQFDPGCFPHINKNREYIPYFSSNIMQYTMHKAMCNAAGITKPIFKCTICKSKKAGKKLRALMSLGRSKTWQETIKVLTGEPDITTDALLEYYSPLEKWLDNHRKQNGYRLGWTLSDEKGG
eukprot:gene18117-19927_t